MAIQLGQNHAAIPAARFNTILSNAHWWYRKREQAEIAGTDSALVAQDTSCALEELAAWLEGEASYLAELWRIQRMYVLEKLYLNEKETKNDRTSNKTNPN